MAMKDQDGAPATKGDIKALLSLLVTKEDEKAFATKEDLKSLATKDDLKAVERKLALEIVKTHGRIDQLREDLRGEMGIKVSDIFKKIDGFMSKVGKADRAQVIADWRMTQIEKRVGAIESRPS